MITVPQTATRADPRLDLSNNLMCRRRRPGTSAFCYRQPTDLVRLLDWVSRTQHGASAHGYLTGGCVQINLAFGVDVLVQPGDFLVADPETPQGWRRLNEHDFFSLYETVSTPQTDLDWGSL